MISYDMPESEYRALPGYGSTDLKNALRSYHHMFAARETFHETPALRFGRAFHCAILEPERYAKEYIVMPEFTGKGCRERKEHWLLEHAGQQCITAEDQETIAAMAGAIRKHDAAFNLLLDCELREVSLTWDQSVRGFDLKMKARLDGIDHEWVVIDLKTTIDASPESFGRQCAQLNYLLQAAHYIEGAIENGLRGLEADFVFIAVEKEPPFGIGVYRIRPAELKIGRDLRRQAITNLVEGHLKRTPYASTIQPLQLPAWAYRGQE